jgi:hypothetical protein
MAQALATLQHDAGICQPTDASGGARYGDACTAAALWQATWPAEATHVSSAAAPAELASGSSTEDCVRYDAHTHAPNTLHRLTRSLVGPADATLAPLLWLVYGRDGAVLGRQLQLRWIGGPAVDWVVAALCDTRGGVQAFRVTPPQPGAPLLLSPQTPASRRHRTEAPKHATPPRR